MEDLKKCQHAACSCPALPLQDYCGIECEVATLREAKSDAPLERCHCQHPDCGGEAEVSADVQGLLIASEVLAAT